jgi:hypothetical protein
MKSSKLRRVVIMTTLTLVGALLPVLPSQSAPAIQLLNPSGYSGTLRISTKDDGNGNTTYHLVAWASEVPTNPLVEFEIGATPTIPGGPEEPSLATVTATRVGNDTFQGDLTTETLTDGQYFLRAILYGGFTVPGSGTEVARDQEPVTVQSGDAVAANTAEMAYPANGGPFGFWRTGTNPAVGVVTGFASAGTNQVRVLYSVTPPGQQPVWDQCGFGPVARPSNEFRVRCTLAATANPNAVRAIAAVANRTPSPAPAVQGNDETGDAHRVVPYAQNPSAVTVDPASSQTEQNKCTPLTATIKDQSGNPVAGLNVDIHAVGPDDQLRFATEQGTNSAFQAPDAAHSGNEATVKCEPTDADGRQGEHSVPGGDDVKHIESTPGGGTNNAGQFTFILRTGVQGGTQVTVWGDENDDDNVTASTEAVGSAQLGWGEPAPQPVTTLTLDPSSATGNTGGCVRFEASATQGGTAQAGRNVDIHIQNPSGVAFCDPGGSTAVPPNAGGHDGDVDTGAENTHHAEGTTSSTGDVIFGVTSSQTGDTSIIVWLDENDSDSQDGGETATAGTVEWLQPGGRGVTLQSSSKSVRKGARVTFSGRISGAETCQNDQPIKIKARKMSGGRFKSFASTRTNDDGAYSVNKQVKKSKKYRAFVPKTGPCNKARSKTITVRVK